MCPTFTTYVSTSLSLPLDDDENPIIFPTLNEHIMSTAALHSAATWLTWPSLVLRMLDLLCFHVGTHACTRQCPSFLILLRNIFYCNNKLMAHITKWSPVLQQKGTQCLLQTGLLAIGPPEIQWSSSVLLRGASLLDVSSQMKYEINLNRLGDRTRLDSKSALYV